MPHQDSWTTRLKDYIAKVLSWAHGQITLMGKPPALPGDSQSLTVPGIATSLRSVNRSQGHGKETDRERQPNPKPYEVGMQISCRVYPQRAAQSAVRSTARRLGRGVPGAGPTEGEQGGGEAC